MKQHFIKAARYWLSAGSCYYVAFPIKSDANDSFKGPTIGSKSDKGTMLTDRLFCSACFLNTSSAIEFSVNINFSALGQHSFH